MDKHEVSFASAVAMAVLIGFGQLLDTKEKVTWRKALGRAISSAGLGATGGLVLVFVPDVHPVAILAFGAGMASLGTSALEALFSKRFGGSDA